MSAQICDRNRSVGQPRSSAQNSICVREGPSRERWEMNKSNIYRLYVEEAQKFGQVLHILRIIYDFEAT
jgi:Clr5 domain